MTFKRNQASDIAATQKLLVNPPMNTTKPNWLGHNGGNADIDYGLLTGITMANMEQHRKAVREHLRHLKVEHGLHISVNNGIYKFQ